jgi:TRAP-type transport system periplasmic protein
MYAKKYLVGALASLGLTIGVGTSADARDLVFGMFLPPKHEANTLGMQPYFDDLRTKSNGSLNWELLAGGQLFSAKATLASVGKGIADGGLAVYSYTQSDLPNAYTITDLHMLGSDFLAATGAMLETVFFDCPECLSDFKNNDVVSIGGYSPGIYKLVCATEVNSLADVKGLRVRTTGPTGRWAEAMGAVPTSMSSAEVPEALRRGIVDCYAGPIAWVDTYKLYDSIKTIVDIPMGIYKGSAFVINRDLWFDFSEEEQRMMLDGMPETIARINVEGYAASDDKARAEASNHDITINSGSDEFKELLAQHIKNDLALVADLAKERNVENPQRIIDAYMENLNEWEAHMAEVGPTVEAFAAALRDRVYSKVDPSKL